MDMSIRKASGTVLQNDKSDEIIYIPPEDKTLLRNKMANWESFYCFAVVIAITWVLPNSY